MANAEKLAFQKASCVQDFCTSLKIQFETDSTALPLNLVHSQFPYKTLKKDRPVPICDSEEVKDSKVEVSQGITTSFLKPTELHPLINEVQLTESDVWSLVLQDYPLLEALMSSVETVLKMDKSDASNIVRPDDQSDSVRPAAIVDHEHSQSLQSHSNKCFERCVYQTPQKEASMEFAVASPKYSNQTVKVESYHRCSNSKKIKKRGRGKGTVVIKPFSVRKARKTSKQALLPVCELSYDDYVCSFCQQKGNVNNLGYLYGPYRLTVSQSEFQINNKSTRSFVGNDVFSQESELWVHEECAVWAPGVGLVGTTLIGLEKAILEGEIALCCVCNQPQATLYCQFKGCGAVFHYPCALSVNCSFREDVLKVSCLKHALQNQL